MNHTFVSPEALGFSSERLARIKPVMQAYVDRHGFSGISTLLARRGQVVHFEQVGWLRPLPTIPLDLAPTRGDTASEAYAVMKPPQATPHSHRSTGLCCW